MIYFYEKLWHKSKTLMKKKKLSCVYPHTQTTYYNCICNLSNKILFNIPFIFYLYPEFYNFKLNKVNSI